MLIYKMHQIHVLFVQKQWQSRGSKASQTILKTDVDIYIFTLYVGRESRPGYSSISPVLTLKQAP